MKKRIGRAIIGILLSMMMVFNAIPLPFIPASMVVHAATNAAKIGDTEYETLDSAISAVSSGETITLLTDVTISSTLLAPYNKTVTLDLNGYGILQTGDRRVIGVGMERSFILKDSNDTTTHYITLSDGRGTAVSDTQPSGTEGTDYIKVIGGYITGGMGSSADGSGSKSGGGVMVGGNNSTFTMEAGTICGCKSINTGGGGGVYSFNGAAFNMKGGTITNCTAQGGGGGVYIDNSTFNMEAGTICGCETKTTGGGGVLLGQGEFNMKGGTITDCTANMAGGVYANDTFNMSGGTIQKCTAVADDGGGVLISSGKTFTMTGGSITNCIAADGYNGGGVYVAGSFNVKESPNISDNKAGSIANNVSFDGTDRIISVTGVLKNGARIYVNGDAGAIIASGSGYTLVSNDAEKFHSDVDSNLLGALDSGKVVFKKTLTEGMIESIADRTYTGSAIEPTVTVKDGNKTLVADTDYTVTYSNNTNSAASNDVNAPTVTVTGKGGYCGTVTRKFSITPKSATITGLTVSNKIFDGTATAEVSGTATIEGKVENDDVRVAAGTAAFSDANAGTGKTVTFSGWSLAGAAKDNYTLAAQPESVTADINKADTSITIVTSSYSKTYGDAAFTLTGITTTPADASLTYTVSDSKNAANESVENNKVITVDESGNVTIDGAGSARITVALPESQNYNAAESKAIDVTVAKCADPAVVTTTATLQKGGKTLDLSSLITGAKGTVSFALKNGHDGGCSLDGNTLTSGTGEGTAVVTVTIADSDNCDGRNTDEITVTIVDKEARSLTVTQEDVTYGGTAVNPSYTVVSGAINETVSYTGTLRKDGSAYSSSDAPDEAGSYSVTVSYETDTEVYTGSTTFTIKPLNIGNAVVTLDSSALAYTGSEQTKNVIKVEIGDKTIAAGDYEVSGNTGTNAGSYTVTVTAKDSSNYTGMVTKGFTISKVSVSVAADEKTKKYGEDDPELSFSATGFVNGETADSLASGSLTREAGEDVGTYAIKAGTLSFGDNYSISYTGANFEITKADGDTVKPAKPELKSKTDTTVEVCTVDGYEYSKDNGSHWQSSGVFTGLTADTEYNIVTRKAETANVKAGAVSDALTVKTNADATVTTVQDSGTITGGTGTIVTESIIEPNVPTTTISNLTTELAESLLTDAEKTAVQDGQKLTLTLDVKSIDNSVPETDKTLIQNAAKNKASNAVVGLYLDILLQKKIGDGAASNVSDTHGRKIGASISVPSDLRNTSSSITRTFYIIRIHGGVATVLASTTATTIPFESDLFSSYALAYSDKSNSTPPPTPPVTNYTVSFDMGGHGTAIAAQTIASGGKVTKPTDPTAEGYTFGGWFTDAACTKTYDFSKTVNSSFTLYAKWVKKDEKFTVSFNMMSHGETIAAQTVSAGQTLTRPEPDPVAEGYDFGGWFTEEECENEYDFTAPVTGNFYLYAKWTIRKYTVSFNMGGKTVEDAPVTQNVEHGKTAVRPEKDPETEGFVFTNWYTEAACENAYDFSTPVTGNIELFAGWREAKKFSVSFNMNGKTATDVPETQRVEEGKCAVEPAVSPKTEGFKFAGWYKEAECETHFDFNSPVTADTEVYAKWVAEDVVTFTVTFDLNGKPGTAPSAQTVEKDKTATEPGIPVAEGFTFTGWYTESSCKTKYNFATPVTADITLYAGWESGEPVVIEEGADWNLYEDASVHEFKIQGINVNGTVANSNAKSKAYYDAKISGSTITVKVTGDRKKAASNAVLEFDLGKAGVITYVLPVSYVKPSFKLSSATATIKSGTETVLKTTLLVKNADGSFEPYDMTDVKVSGTGLGTVTKAADGCIEIKTSAAGKGKISIIKETWDSATPVSLNFTVKGSKTDVLSVDLGGLKTVVVNSNAKGQVLRYDVTLNGAVPAEGAVTIVDKKNAGLATIGENGKLVITYKDGVKKGTYTIALQAGEAETKVKIKVSDKALDKAITAKVQTKYDVVTKQSMVVVPKLKDVSGTIEAVSVAENGFIVSLNAAGNIVIDYTGDKYNVKNLNIGTLTLSIKISGIEEPVKLTLNKVKAKKTTPKVKVGTVTIPANAEAVDGKVIGTANIVSSYKVSSGMYRTIKPVKIEIVSTPKNVTAMVNESDMTEIDIYSISKKNVSFKVKLTYAGGVTKTVTVKVKRK